MAPLRTCHSNCPQALPTSTSHRQFPLAQAPPIDTSQSHGRCSLAPTLAYPSIMSLIASQRYFAIGLLLLLPLPHTHTRPLPWRLSSSTPTPPRTRAIEIENKMTAQKSRQNIAAKNISKTWPAMAGHAQPSGTTPKQGGQKLSGAGQDQSWLPKALAFTTPFPPSPPYHHTTLPLFRSLSLSLFFPTTTTPHHSFFAPHTTTTTPQHTTPSFMTYLSMLRSCPLRRKSN